MTYRKKACKSIGKIQAGCKDNIDTGELDNSQNIIITFPSRNHSKIAAIAVRLIRIL